MAPKLLGALSTIQARDHPQLRATAIRLLGDLSRWAKYHPAAMSQIWGALLEAAQEKAQRAGAVKSILILCENARSAFTPHLDELISLVGQCDEVGLDRGDTNRLLRACAEVIAHLPAERMGAAFGALVGPIDAKLKADVGAGSSPFPALERFGEVKP